jgi:hypothetical protein
MTVSTTQIRVSYTGDGSSTAFPIPYPFYLATDLMVLLGGSVITTGFSISGGGFGSPLVASTGTLNMAVAPTTGTNLQIVLNDPLTQLVNLVDGTAFPSATLNQVNDRAVQIAQRLQDQLNRSIRAPDGDTSPGMLLPAAASRQSMYLATDANGNIIATSALPGTANTPASLGPIIYPQTTAEGAALVAPTNYLFAPYDVRRYGAQQTNTSAQNLAALNTAILVAQNDAGAASLGGVVITIPASCHYGYKLRTLSTHPQINSGTTPITVIDYSQGESYAGYPTAYDGNQIRWFSYTPQPNSNSSDGNGFRHSSIYYPYIWIDNAGGLANPSTGAFDNRRANFLVSNDGVATWQIGQGTVSGVGFAPGQMSNFQIAKANGGAQTLVLTGNPAGGATTATLASPWPCGIQPGAAIQFSNPAGDIRAVTLTNGSTAISWSPGLTNSCTAPTVTLGPTMVGGAILIVDYYSQRCWFNTGANQSDASYHFKSPVIGFFDAVFESLTGQCEVRLRNPNGASQDVSVKNETGALALSVNALGSPDVLVFQTNGQGQAQYGFSEALKALAYGSSITPTCALGNYFTINATNNTAFTINAPTNPANGMRITIEISNTSGGALGTITWNAVFKMNAFPSPGNGNSTAIDFRYNGTNWRQVGTPVAVPN